MGAACRTESDLPHPCSGSGASTSCFSKKECFSQSSSTLVYFEWHRKPGIIVASVGSSALFCTVLFGKGFEGNQSYSIHLCALISWRTSLAHSTKATTW